LRNVVLPDFIRADKSVMCPRARHPRQRKTVDLAARDNSEAYFGSDQGAGLPGPPGAVPPGSPVADVNFARGPDWPYPIAASRPQTDCELMGRPSGAAR
jgi:hypothetical protein